MSHTLGPCSQQLASTRALRHSARSSVVPCAYKKNNQQQRGPGFVDVQPLPPLPPLDPSEVSKPAPVNKPQQQQPRQPAGNNPYTDPAVLNPQNPGQQGGYPGQQGGYMPMADPAYAPQQQNPNYNPYPPRGPPPGPQPGYNNNPNRNNNRQSGYQTFTDPMWATPPSQNGGWNGGYNNRNNRGGYNNGNNRGFQGFDDATTDMLLQDLDGFGQGYGTFGQDRWVDEVVVEVEEDTSPKYVNGKRVLVNREIEAPQVRVQDALKQELGVMAFDEARQLALKSDADVVLINEGGDPPVVRLIAFGKYKFELERAAKAKQKSSKGTETKEVRLRPVTEPHDYEVKVKAARGFLAKGSKVKLTMQFSGREMRFKDQGKEMMLKLIEDLSTTSKMDAPLSLRPSTFSVTLSPLKP